MNDLAKDLGKFKAPADDPEWIYVAANKIVHAFPFRDDNETEPWMFVMTHAFLGWRAVRRGDDLLMIPDRENWGLA